MVISSDPIVIASRSFSLAPPPNLLNNSSAASNIIISTPSPPTTLLSYSFLDDFGAAARHLVTENSDGTGTSESSWTNTKLNIADLLDLVGRDFRFTGDRVRSLGCAKLRKLTTQILDELERKDANIGAAQGGNSKSESSDATAEEAGGGSEDDLDDWEKELEEEEQKEAAQEEDLAKRRYERERIENDPRQLICSLRAESANLRCGNGGNGGLRSVMVPGICNRSVEEKEFRSRGAPDSRRRQAELSAIAMGQTVPSSTNGNSSTVQNEEISILNGTNPNKIDSRLITLLKRCADTSKENDGSILLSDKLVGGLGGSADAMTLCKFSKLLMLALEREVKAYNASGNKKSGASNNAIIRAKQLTAIAKSLKLRMKFLGTVLALRAIALQKAAIDADRGARHGEQAGK